MDIGGNKTSEPHRFRLTLADKLNLKDPNINMALVNLSIYFPTWNDEFDFPDGSYSVSDIQHYY